MFDKLADFIMKNAKKIVAFWLILLLLCVPLIVQSGSSMQYDMNGMKSSKTLESVKGNEYLKSGQFNSGSNLSGGTILLVEAYDTQALTVMEQMDTILQNSFYFWSVNEDLREKYGPGYEVTIKALVPIDDKYFKDKDTSMILFTVTYPILPDGTQMKGSNYVPDVRKMVADAVEQVDGVVETYVTGTDAISYDTKTGSLKDIKRIDPFSILLILILIGLFFRSFVTAGTPPVVIGMAYGLLLAVCFGIGQFVGIFYITTILALITMLGAGCDYCIFIISRYREERKEGRDHEDALRQSIIWAGESILTSGISVMIGFGSLMLCSFSLVSVMGMVLAAGVLLALLAALTFVPSLLMLVGDRIFWPSKISTYREGGKATKGWYGKISAFGAKYFTHSAKTSIKYAKPIVIAALLLTVPLGYMAFASEPSYDMISAMPDSEGKEGVRVVSENLGGGMLMPTTITMKVDAFVDVNTGMTFNSGDTVPLGTTVEMTARPYPGYTVSGWTINGAADTVTDTVRTIHIDSPGDFNVSVNYVRKAVTVTPAADITSGNGTVTAEKPGETPVSAPIAVDFGKPFTVRAVPEAGYRVGWWEISRDGSITVEHVHDEVFEFSEASYEYIITAYFEPVPQQKFAVSFSSSANGTVVARADGAVFESGSPVDERSYVVFSAIPDAGYEIEKWTVNGTDLGTRSGQVAIDSLDGAKEVKVYYRHVETAQVTIDFAADGDGTVTATSNGSPIASGTKVDVGSKIVLTAVPGEGKVVEKWRYGTSFPYLDSYTDRTVTTIASVGYNQHITVFFSDPSSDMAIVDYSSYNPSMGSVSGFCGGTDLAAGGSVPYGSELFFRASPADGMRVDHWEFSYDGGATWTENGRSVNSVSLYNVHGDVQVRAFFTPLTLVRVAFSVNDGNMGTLEASCTDTRMMYSERMDAAETLRTMDDFAASLMALQTGGKNNVALAIGPMNGDILFDGNHAWVWDTIAGILPREFTVLFPASTYDALCAIWVNGTEIAPSVKEAVNYYLAYKAGFVSQVFTEDGHEYQYVKFMVVTKEEPMSALSVDTIKQLYAEKDDFIAENSAEIGGFAHNGYLSGAAVQNYESSELVSDDFKVIIFVVMGLLCLLLFVVLKSYLTPIRAVATIVMSVVWTLGLTYILFEHILGMPVVWIVPIVLFVVCLGLGMDYDILLTTRIKECVTKGMTNDEGIVEAVQKSGAIITLCGMIMAGAFFTMLLSSSPMLMQFGFALGFAIAVDALVIRTYVVPAIMHLMGDWNWKGPSRAISQIPIISGIVDGNVIFAVRENAAAMVTMRESSGYLGILAGLIMAAFGAAACFVAGLGFGTATMSDIYAYSESCRMCLKLAFALGGAVLAMFGASVARNNPSIEGKAAGVLYLLSGAGMIVASTMTVHGQFDELMWTAAFGTAVAASAIYMHFAFRTKHGLAAGAMFLAVSAFTAAALSGAMALSFGLMIPAVASVLIAGFCESAKIE